MKATKDIVNARTSQESAGDEIARTVKLATQACDGHQLSDQELEELCDAVLIVGEGERQTKMKGRR